MILDPKLTGQLPEVVAEGAYYGMQTFDQHLLKHLRAGRVTFDEAMLTATSPHDFKLMVAAEGPLPTPAAKEAEAQPEPQYTASIGESPAPPSFTSPPAPSPAGPPPPSAPPPGMFS
jgi:twitching motility protein PilT